LNGYYQTNSNNLSACGGKPVRGKRSESGISPKRGAECDDDQRMKSTPWQGNRAGQGRFQPSEDPGKAGDALAGCSVILSFLVVHQRPSYLQRINTVTTY